MKKKKKKNQGLKEGNPSTQTKHLEPPHFLAARLRSCHTTPLSFFFFFYLSSLTPRWVIWTTTKAWARLVIVYRIRIDRHKTKTNEKAHRDGGRGASLSSTAEIVRKAFVSLLSASALADTTLIKLQLLHLSYSIYLVSAISLTGRWQTDRQTEVL